MNPESLIKGCLNHERTAQNALYNAFASKVMGICIRYTKNKEQAEDIFQDAFLKIFQNIAQIKEAQTLEKWIRVVTINVAVNHYRKVKSKKEYCIPELDENTASGFENVISVMSNTELIDLINTIPHGYKVVFNLYVIDGYSHKEISQMLNISEGTSKSQLFKAKSLIKRKLKILNQRSHEKRILE